MNKYDRTKWKRKEEWSVHERSSPGSGVLRKCSNDFPWQWVVVYRGGLPSSWFRIVFCDLMCQDSSRVSDETVACPSSHLSIFEYICIVLCGCTNICIWSCTVITSVLVRYSLVLCCSSYHPVCGRMLRHWSTWMAQPLTDLRLSLSRMPKHS